MPTLSARLRAAQDELEATASELSVIWYDANHIGLAPFRLAEIRATKNDTLHAARQLNDVIRALELPATAPTIPPCNPSTPREP